MKPDPQYYDTVDASDLIDSDASEFIDVFTPHYPKAMRSLAYHGLYGEFVNLVAPHTEASSEALLLQTIVATGNLLGRGPYFIADGSHHYANLFAVIVGRSSKARKGTSWSHVKNLTHPIDLEWNQGKFTGGLVSGEGMCWEVRDPIFGPPKDKHGVGILETTIKDEGITDKRRLFVESEFSGMLRILEREGNSLSSMIRECFDSGNLRTASKHNPGEATNAHVSIIGHTTETELRRYLSSTESANGFGNRHLWCMAKRSKELPEGSEPDAEALNALREKFRQAVIHGQACQRMEFDTNAKILWRSTYSELSREVPGQLGAITSRGEALVKRLALIFAVMDCAPAIQRVHLEASLEVWRYCFDSAEYLFGDSLGDPTADRILSALIEAGSDGLTRSNLTRDVLKRNKSQREIGRAFALLRKLNKAKRERDNSGAGRAVERWVYTPHPTTLTT
jgi:hypothetical protein